jgi:hypothetical protein
MCTGCLCTGKTMATEVGLTHWTPRGKRAKGTGGALHA